MAKTVKTTTRDVLDTYLASFGHGGRLEESQFTTFFGPNFNEKDISGLVAEYNNCVYTGNYGSFFRALGLANEAYDLRGKDDFDAVLARGQQTKLPGLIKDKAHRTSASRERGLEGVRTLLRKKDGISKDKAVSVLCAVSYTERLLAQTEPHREYLAKVQKLAVKGPFVEQNKTGKMKLDPKVQAVLKNRFGFDQVAEDGSQLSPVSSSILEYLSGKQARLPKLEGEADSIHFDQNSGSPLNYTNVGLRSIEEVANQTASAVLLPKIKEMILTEGRPAPLIDSFTVDGKEEASIIESLVCVNPKDTLESVSARVESFVTYIKALEFGPDAASKVPLSSNPELLDGLLKACAVTGAFAAQTSEEFLYRATQAATLPEFTSVYASIDPAATLIHGSAPDKAEGLLFVDGNIHAVEVPTRTTTYPDGQTATTIDVRTREDVEGIARPLKEEGAITSVNNISANDFALTNEVAGQLHAAHELSANRIAGFDAEATSGSLGAGRKAIDSSYSLALFRSTPYYLQRKQATLARIQKYCGHLLQGISDASREIYVKDFASEPEFDYGGIIQQVGGSDNLIAEIPVVDESHVEDSSVVAEAGKGVTGTLVEGATGPANTAAADASKVAAAPADMGGQGQE